MLPTGADVAMLIIVFQYLVLIVIALVVTAGTAYALIQLNHKVKEIMPVVQQKSRQAADTTDRVSNKVAGPFISREAGSARRKAERDYIFASLRRRRNGS